MQYKIRTRDIGRRKFLKSIAFVGAIVAMGFSGCVSTPESTPTLTPAPTPTPTQKPTASDPTPTSKQTTKSFFDVGTDLKPCQLCDDEMHLQDVYGVLWWICEHEDCKYFEKVTEPEILKKYGYTEQLKSI